MKTKIALTLAVVLALSNVTLCAKAKYVKRWKNPEAQPVTWKGKKVLAFVRTRLTDARPGAEQAIVRELEKLGIQGVQGNSLFPPETERNQEVARRILTEAGITGALIMHVVDVKEEVQDGGGQTYLAPRYNSFYSGWESGYGLVPAGPASMALEATFVVETLVYSVDQDKLVWRGTSEITDAEEVDKIVRELIGATGKELKKAGLTGGR